MDEFQLSNGIKVYFMKKSQVPLIQLNFYIKAGSANETKDQLGLASLTSNMMDEGAGTRNTLEIADQIDFLGIDLTPFSGLNRMGVRLFSPTSKLNDALSLMSDILMKPTFPANELERLRKELLIDLGQQHDESRTIARRAFNQTIFGKDHPMGRTSMGTEKTLRSFQVSDLQKFHDKYFVADNAYVVAVGDIEANDLKEKLEEYFGSMKQGKANEVSISNPNQVKGRVIYLVDKPGSAQSEVYWGRVGVNRTTPDYYNITVMNTILGGSFTSRLNQNLRETHGYTYGAGSFFSMGKSTGYFLAYSSVQTDVTDKALHEFMKELTSIDSITDDDMTRARNYVALGYPQDFSSVQSIAGNIAEKVEFNLPDDYFNNYVRNILSVNKDDVIKAASEYVDPDNMAVIVVGDLSKIEKGIRALKLGEIKILKVDDILGPVPKVE